MASKENVSDMVQQEAPTHFQWQPSGTVCHTCVSTASPHTRILPQLSKELSGPHYAEQKSPQHSASQPQITRPQVEFTPDNFSARSMRANDAMAFLMARVDIDTIRLVGRWRSDKMLRYLHTTAQTFTEGLVARMVQHGDYALTSPTHGD